jgi:hypothetical protein
VWVCIAQELFSVGEEKVDIDVIFLYRNFRIEKLNPDVEERIVYNGVGEKGI